MSDRIPNRIPMSEAAQQAQIRRRRVVEEVSHATSTDSDSPESPVESAGRRRPGFVRKPFGSREQKLRYPDRPGYHRHWFNDEPGRLMRAADAGYEQVNDKDGRPVSTVVGIARGGGPLTAYLHEIPQEWYDEDMLAQEAPVHEMRQQIATGEFERPAGKDGQARYAGSTRGGISIKDETRR